MAKNPEVAVRTANLEAAAPEKAREAAAVCEEAEAVLAEAAVQNGNFEGRTR